MRSLTIGLVFVLAIISSCKGEKKLSDIEKIEQSVRSYLFIGDSIDVEISIKDTIHLEELDAMLSTTAENLRLIQMDIDTLGSIIDGLAYDMQENDQNQTEVLDLKEPIDVDIKEYQLIKYKYHYSQLMAQKLQFSQTNRILFHLKRSVWANIAGFDIVVKYQVGEESIETMVLTDADFIVVD